MQVLPSPQPVVLHVEFEKNSNRNQLPVALSNIPVINTVSVTEFPLTILLVAAPDSTAKFCEPLVQPCRLLASMHSIPVFDERLPTLFSQQS